MAVQRMMRKLAGNGVKVQGSLLHKRWKETSVVRPLKKSRARRKKTGALDEGSLTLLAQVPSVDGS